jgi:hypothetical protein
LSSLCRHTHKLGRDETVIKRFLALERVLLLLTDEVRIELLVSRLNFKLYEMHIKVSASNHLQLLLALDK